ncbi:hypothetical protein EV1_036398 [Malus domestica]
MGLAAIFYRLKTLLLLQYYSVFALTYFLLFHVCRCYPRVDGGCLSISPVLRALISISSACTRSSSSSSLTLHLFLYAPLQIEYRSRTINPSGRKTHEEILVVGRQPDCNIVLTHSSISRFQLQTLSTLFAKIVLTDLSSGDGYRWR